MAQNMEDFLMETPAESWFDAYILIVEKYVPLNYTQHLISSGTAKLYLPILCTFGLVIYTPSKLCLLEHIMTLFY
jgi:hypothetical protein